MKISALVCVRACRLACFPSWKGTCAATGEVHCLIVCRQNRSPVHLVLTTAYSRVQVWSLPKLEACVAADKAGARTPAPSPSVLAVLRVSNKAESAEPVRNLHCVGQPQVCVCVCVCVLGWVNVG